MDLTTAETQLTAPPPATGQRWRQARGLQFLGPVQGSGLKDPAFLVRRVDDQVVQLSELLHLVVRAVEPPRPAEQVADDVSAAYGRTLSVRGLEHLVTTRLEPLGLVVPDESPEPLRPARARPLLALTAKGTLVPAGAVGRLAGALAPLFWPPLVALALVALVVLDVVMLTGGGLWSAIGELFATPTIVLVIYALLTAAALVHEVGHAAACRYGGAHPGEIGFGLYLVFPAFYTDVTDSYRLGRAGRVRTDLGGLHFNVLTVLVLAGAHLATGSGVLLLTALVLQVQMLQQLIPVVRFDGYYVLSDLAGVPDLFARVGPVLRSLRPGHPEDPRVRELRPRSRRFVIGWVLVVVPVLTAALAWAVWHLPEFVARGADGVRLQQLVFDVAWERRDWPAMALAVVSIALLLLPILGAALAFWRLGTTLFLLARARIAASTPPSYEPAVVVAPDPPRVLTAADFTDEVMYAAPAPVPTQGWRSAVYRGSGHLLNPGPSLPEQRRRELERRLRTPVDGSRRVVVMSRKGGVGKTTITLALGSTFALLRGDRVIAVDANPDAGNLAHRVAPPHDRTVTDVLRDLDQITTYAALRRYTSQAAESRLEVVASDDDPGIGRALDRDDYHRLIGLLDRFYNVILLDTGTGILDSANQGLLTEADQVVLVGRAGLDGGRAGALTLDWMDQHGFEDLVARTVVVVNAERRGSEPPEPMRRHFEKRCARVVTVPWDDALEPGALTDMSALHRNTRDALVDIAAAVADNFVVSEPGP